MGARRGSNWGHDRNEEEERIGSNRRTIETRETYLDARGTMRLTIIAGLIMGLALGFHSVLGTHSPAGGEHAAVVQPPHVSRAHVHRNRIVLRSAAAKLEPSAAARTSTRPDSRMIADDGTRARLRRTTSAIILWTVWPRS